MTNAKRYLKIMIFDELKPGGSYASDLVDPVSKKHGKPTSVRKISMYLRSMFKSGEVRREEETKSGCMVRFKWFKI